MQDDTTGYDFDDCDFFVFTQEDKTMDKDVISDDSCSVDDEECLSCGA